MRKQIALLFAAAAFLMLSCNSHGGSDGYTLKMRLNKGDKFSQAMTMDMDMNMTVMGMQKDVKMKMDVGTDFEVLDSTAAGKDLKITYNKMVMHMDAGMGNNAMMDSLMNKSTGAVVGKSVVVTFAGNKVTDVKGFDELMAGNTSDSTTRKMMEKMFSKDNFNSMFGMMFGLYPNKPVKEGESWSTVNNMDISGMNMGVNTKYTLLGVKDNIAEIGVDGTVDSKGTMKQGAVNMDMDMKGTQKGKLNVKLSDGYLQTGTYDMDITADMNVMGQKMPMKMKATYTLKGN